MTPDPRCAPTAVAQLLFIPALVAMLAGSASRAAADQITFRIKLEPEITTVSFGSVIKGEIEIQHLDQPKWQSIVLIDLPQPGVRTISEITCKLGTYFTAKVNNTLYRLDPWDTKKECKSGEITFTFRAKKYAGKLLNAIGESDFSNLSNSDQLAAWKRDFDNAVKSNDTSGTLKWSALLADGLRVAGAPAKAEPFRIFNLDTAKRTLLGPSAELFFDPQQKKFVLDNEAVTAIKQLQVRENLQASGNLDWNTMKAITGASQM